MPVSMVRESKSAATIRRRRKGHQVQVRHKTHSLDESWDSGEEDPEMPFEPSQEGPKFLQLIMSSEKTLFLGLLAFRFINALMVQTSYVPDEYWQSIEVAHNIAFGYGYKTWEWRHGLRSYFYPGVFAFVYKILGILRMDSRLLLIKVPRLMQSVMAALGDLYLFKLTRQQHSQEAAWWSLLCQLTSWFTFFCATRTLTNSTETVLTTIALYYFPWPEKARKAQWKYITLVGLAVAIRPTAAIVWLPLCAWHLYLYKPVMWRVVKIFAERGFVILSISSIIDRVFYGRWENVHYNFLRFNVLENMGSFYGSHPWHWYLTQGFAVIMGPQIFPFILAMRKGTEKVFLGVIFWTVFVYSVLAHKEFRFLFPILPMAMHVCGVFLHSVCDEDEVGEEEDETDRRPTPEATRPREERNNKAMSRKKFLIVLLILTNLPLALYTSLLHQRGTIDVMKYVNDQACVLRNQGNEIDVLFLMPCHSTPYYGYIHQNISMRFLTCEPNVTHNPAHVDVADVFFKNPLNWMSSEFSTTNQTLPTHLVMFNPLEVTLGEYMFNNRYFSCAKFFHSHVPEGRVGSHVVVYCRKLDPVKKQRLKMPTMGR